MDDEMFFVLGYVMSYILRPNLSLQCRTVRKRPAAAELSRWASRGSHA